MLEHFLSPPTPSLPPSRLAGLPEPKDTSHLVELGDEHTALSPRIGRWRRLPAASLGDKLHRAISSDVAQLGDPR